MRLRIGHVADEYEPRYVVLDEGESITIGSARTCNVVVPDADVANAHLRVTLRGTAIVAEGIASQDDALHHVWLDDALVPLATPFTCDVEGTIRIGNTVIQLEHASVAPRAKRERMPAQLDRAELEVLRRLTADPSDDTLREVYADWLEGAGFPLRAGFVRDELEEIDAAISESERLFKMVGASSVAWRCLVSRALVRDCDLGCVQRWHELQPAEDFVRRCARCRRAVPYVNAHSDLDEVQAPAVYDAGLGYDDK